MLRMTVLPMATTVRIGLLEEFSSGRAHGSTGIMAFMATSTSATILITVTMDRCQNAGSRPSLVFVPTERTMNMGTRVLPGMTGVASTTPDFREEDTPVEVVTPAVAAVIAKRSCCEKARFGGPFCCSFLHELQTVYLW
jgi:hypothetical protein